jgi:hypothetical protein
MDPIKLGIFKSKMEKVCYIDDVFKKNAVVPEEYFNDNLNYFKHLAFKENWYIHVVGLFRDRIYDDTKIVTYSKNVWNSLVRRDIEFKKIDSEFKEKIRDFFNKKHEDGAEHSYDMMLHGG